MRNKIYLLAAYTFALLLTACDKRLDEDVKLDMKVTSEEAYNIGDTLVVKRSTDVVFNFSGNPDFITFYSGENGREYSKRHLTESPVDQITSRLELATKTQYGSNATVAGTLKVYISTEFTGMVKNNKKTDSIAVEKTNWIDITDLCQIPQKPGGASPRVNVPLDQYLGKQRLTVAFEYHTTDNSSAQPVWEIYDLKVVNTLISNGIESNIKAVNMGFTPLDMYAVGNAAYNTVSDQTPGVWNVSNISNASDPKIRIHSTSTGGILNHDWLISNPFIINARTPDSGIGIKTITTRLDSYKYRYDTTGVYVVTVIGRNSNFESTSEVVREVVLKVID